MRYLPPEAQRYAALLARALFALLARALFALLARALFALLARALFALLARALFALLATTPTLAATRSKTATSSLVRTVMDLTSPGCHRGAPVLVSPLEKSNHIEHGRAVEKIGNVQ
jgi:hypothetical protein